MAQININTGIFKLKNFSPIGFKIPNYPSQYCPLCRGYLIDVCNICIEKKCETCNVIDIKGTFYHDHCHKFIDNGDMDTTNKSKGKHPISSSDEDEMEEIN